MSSTFRPRNIALAVLVVLVAIILLWDWNWFKWLVEARASAALGRPVHIGHFDVKLSRQPLIIIDNLMVANPPKSPDGDQMMTVKRLSVRIDIDSLIHGRTYLPEINVESPVGTLDRDPSGTANWQFATSNSKSSSPPPSIGSIIISDGLIHVIDAPLKSDFNLTIHTDHAAAGQEDRLIVDAKGTYAAQPVTAHFIGGSILSLRDPAKPYPIDFNAANGQTRIALTGTVQQPMQFAGADLELTLKGDDLAQLYPLTGIPLASTPPYNIKGKLDYLGNRIRFRQFTGTVGSSDLEGDILVDPSGERTRVSGDLKSQKVVLADLAGFIGNAPGKADAANATGQQREQKKQEEDSPTLLPNTPINLPKLRSADLDIRYTGVRIDSQSTPLDNFVANLKLENGTITLMPLSFGVGTGTISANITLNGQQDQVHAIADIDFRHVDLQRIMESTKIFKGTGAIGGRVTIDATGNSLAQMLGHGNGDMKIFMSGGNMSALLVALAGLDTGRAVITLLGIPDRADIRCMVADAGLEQGVVKTHLLLFDTTESNINGAGTIDLQHESIDYRLTTDAKHFSVGSFGAPIDITGKLKSPSVKPDPAILAERGGVAAIFGVLLTPLGALIPTIDLGLGKDNDCHEILERVEVSAGKKQPTPAKANTAPVVRH